MGGKSQPRLAGNVKPSSSGRIRELLINTHGTGNVITFSTLNNTSKQNEHVQTDASRPETTNERAINYKIRPNRRRCIPMPSEIIISSDSTPVSQKLDEQLQSSLNVSDSAVKVIPSIDESAQSDPKTIVEEAHDFETILDELSTVQTDCDDTKCESLSDLDEKILNQELNLIRLLSILVKEFSQDLSIQEWDLIVRSIYKWVGVIANSGRVSDKIDFCVHVFNFIRELIKMAKKWTRDDVSTREENPMMQSLLDDWSNFHSSSLYQDLLIMFLKLASIGDLNEHDLLVIQALASIIIEIDSKSVNLDSNLAAYVETQAGLDKNTVKLSKNTVFCTIDENKFKGFIAICGLLQSTYRPVSIVAHALIWGNMVDISANAGIEVSDFDAETDDILIAPPIVLMSILLSRDSIMSALLSDFHVGDVSVAIDPKTDSYSCTLAYLLVWDLVIQFIINLDKQVAHRVIHCIKALGLIQRLLDNIFMLLPPLCEKDSLNLKFGPDELDFAADSSDESWTLSNFLRSPLKTTLRRPLNEIELIALHVYFSVAYNMPVTVRRWYNNNSNKRLCNIVNEYTVKHISKIICSLEMDNVQEKCKERVKDDNLVIKARPTASEVYTVYTRDEFHMELTIKLPINYPLGAALIDGGKRVGVTDVKWRSWQLQLTTFLSHQNGSLLDGIDLWRRNIDKKFEGVEKCMICFSILHSNYQLPKKKCQTCFKMFHNLCLYKWFRTSGNSNCPLCRTIW